MQRILSGRRQPIGAHRDDVPAALEEVAARALAQDPEDRYPTAAAMADALHAFLRSVPAVGAADLAALLDEELGDEKAAKESLLAAGGTLERAEGTRTDVDLPPADRSPVEASPTDPVAVAEATRPVSTRGAEPTRSMEEQAPPRRALAWIVVAAVVAVGALAATQLIPSAAPRLRVASSPEGGQVFVDDRALATPTPTELELPAGEHVVRVVHPGYRDAVERIVLREGEPLAIRVALTPETITTIPEALPVVEPAPSDVEPAPNDEPPPHVDTPPNVDETPTRRAASRATRRRPETAAAPGTLSLLTTPWAEVRVGTRDLGTTPLSRIEVPSGTLRVGLRAEGRGPVRTVVIEVHEGGHATRNLRLVDDRWVGRGRAP
ncbi:MAG: PEGA domain-containing protein [Polyangiales bacterium]